MPGWDNVELEFPDGQRVQVDLTRSFWKPETPWAELRDTAIGRWLIAEGAAPWPQGSPPQFGPGATWSQAVLGDGLRLSDLGLRPCAHLGEATTRLLIGGVVCFSAAGQAWGHRAGVPVRNRDFGFGRCPWQFALRVRGSRIEWLGSPSAIRGWADLAELLAAPTILAVLVVSFGIGLARRAIVRVVFYAGLAAWALLISEHEIKPLVQRTYYGELTFPSGNVTAVSATALAMWLAVGPLLGKLPRHVTLVIGGEWVLLMSLAVVGARWHTPLDAIGSVLLSVGVVTAGAALFESVVTPGLCEAMGRDLFGEQGGK